MRNTLRHLFLVALLFPAAAMSQIREEYRPLADLLSTRPEREPTEGNLVELYPAGRDVFLMMQEDIMAAQKTVHAEYFIFSKDEAGFPFRMSLRLKALEGVEVQYLAEDFTHNAGFINKMRKSGVDVRHYPFFPLRRRNHQKILLMDGEVGYSGGLNIDRENLLEWGDMAVRVRGPVVARMEQSFAKMWKHSGGPESACDITESAHFEGGVIVQSVDEDPTEKNHINLNAYIWVLDHAKEYFYAKSPYFKPPREFVEALSNAARRGVDVKLVIPAHKDSPSRVIIPFERVFYEEMVQAGVHIILQSDKFDHGKMFVSDGYLSAVGSINLDALSFVYNFENNLYFYDEGIAAEVKRLIEAEFQDREELTLEEVAHFPVWQRTFMGLFRTLGKVF